MSHYDKKLDNLDMSSLSPTMHLFSYLLPVKGGLVYSTLLFKKKYGIHFKSSINIHLLALSSSFVIIGIIGSIIGINMENLPLILLSIILIIQYPCFACIDNLKLDNVIQKLFRKDFGFFKEVSSAFSNLRIVKYLLLISAIRIPVEYFWINHAAEIMGFEFSPSVIVFFIIMRNASIILSIAPGNLGINEILGGTIAAVSEFGFGTGITLMVFLRIVAFLVALLIGLPSFLYSQKNYKIF